MITDFNDPFFKSVNQFFKTHNQNLCNTTTNILYHNFLKTFSSEFQKIKVWFTDEDSEPLEIEGKVNLNLLIE